MFRSPVTDAVPPTHHGVEPSEQPVPLVELELSLGAPAVGGWDVYLAGHGVPVVADDLGRPAVARTAARMLIAERREAEARSREKAAERERQLVERDRQFRASLGRGIPADAIPAGMTYAEAVASAELDGQAYRPRASVMEDLLDNSGGLTFHPIGPAAPVEE
jgi:hypothetical protein